MQIELNLRESIRLRELLKSSLDVLRLVNDDNYPMRKEDHVLLVKIDKAADPHWNK